MEETVFFLTLAIHLDLKVVESIIVSCGVLHNIACYFGENTPRVSALLEKLINLGTLTTGLNIAPQGALTPGIQKLASLKNTDVGN